MKEIELQTVQKQMVEKKNLLALSIKKKTFNKLPLCPAWLCKGCVWKKQCAPWKVDPKRDWVKNYL